jgi:hypothetical protein
MTSVCACNPPALESLFNNFAKGYYFYIYIVVSTNANGPVAAPERPVPLLGVQRLSTAFNSFKRLSTSAILAVLKRVEQLAAVTFRTSLEGRSTRSGGWELLGR